MQGIADHRGCTLTVAGTSLRNDESEFCGNVCAGDEQFSGSRLVKKQPPPSRPAAARRIGRKIFRTFFRLNPDIVRHVWKCQTEMSDADRIRGQRFQAVERQRPETSDEMSDGGA